MPRRLREDYGHRGPYTPSQIEASIRRHGIGSLRDLDFAVALFCDRAQLAQLQRPGAATNYAAVRRDLGRAFFGGDAEFTARDVARYASEAGGGGPETGHGGEDGGPHGGVGGGHH